MTFTYVRVFLQHCKQYGGIIGGAGISIPIPDFSLSKSGMVPADFGSHCHAYIRHRSMHFQLAKEK